MPEQINPVFTIKPYQALSTDVLYEIMRVRQAVFIVEQDCPYLDADGLDSHATHIYSLDDEKKISAYARILPPGYPYREKASIGRVLTTSQYRNKGLGRAIMRASLNFLDHTYPLHDIKIMAQTYLVDFYQSLGFRPIGEEFLEDGIPHIDMLFERTA